MSIEVLGLLFGGISALAMVPTAVVVVGNALRRPFKSVNDRIDTANNEIGRRFDDAAQSINSRFDQIEGRLSIMDAGLVQIAQTQHVMLTFMKRSVPGDEAELLDNILDFKKAVEKTDNG